MAIINEHWRNASESVEVISFPDGNLTVFIKNSEAIIFESLFDFFQRYQACRSGKKASLNFRFCQNITDIKTTLN